MRLGILTGGGDAPGLNGVIKACSYPLLEKGIELVGICDAFEGVFNQKTIPIKKELLRDIHFQPGTILGSTSDFSITHRPQEFLAHYKKLKLQGLIVLGGDGTFRQLKPLSKEIPLIGVPKTIDNDLKGTEITFGFDTACTVVSEAVESLKYTARSHNRWIVVETMGRDSGWIALASGIATYADAVLLPEFKYSKEKLYKFIKKRSSEQRGGIIIVAEGLSAQLMKTKTDCKHSAAFFIADSIEKELKLKSRVAVLGHLQRGGRPTLFDRLLTAEMGFRASQMVLGKKWGTAIVYKAGKVTTAPVTDLMGDNRLVDKKHPWLELAENENVFVNV